MSDNLYRIMATQSNFFGICCDTTQLVHEACRRHDVGPTAGAALGRALTGAVLLAALLKDGQSVSLRFEGGGPLRKIITEAGYDGWARGYVAEPHADVPFTNGLIDVASGIGRAGFLTVTKDIGLKEKYTGTVQLYTSEIGEDIAYYLTESEQTPSALTVGVQFDSDGAVLAAGGYLVQSLPPADETVIAQLEKKIQTMPPVTQQLLENRNAQEILEALFENIPYKSTGQTSLHYQCSCSTQKMMAALLTLGPEQLQELQEKEDGVEVKCEFCRNSYRFSQEEIGKLAQTDTLQ